MKLPEDHAAHLERAWLSLKRLAIDDAFGAALSLLPTATAMRALHIVVGRRSS